ncbi:MAG: hypothetical protein IJN15_01630 [Clostridia bacterium]|nr:hypothetical protein [Clostridia bacterium]
MTASQYINIIKWSVFLNPNSDNEKLIKIILNNLGVAFPCGDSKEKIRKLETNSFLGWGKSNIDDAQNFANVGVAAICISESKVYIVWPDQETNDLIQSDEIKAMKSDLVKRTNELTDEEKETMRFFVYSYRRAFEG